jgi:hypothetical protein
MSGFKFETHGYASMSCIYKKPRKGGQFTISLCSSTLYPPYICSILVSDPRFGVVDHAIRSTNQKYAVINAKNAWSYTSHLKPPPRMLNDACTSPGTHGHRSDSR